MATVASTIPIGPADHGRCMNLEEFQEAEVEEVETGDDQPDGQSVDGVS
jgi:hypothetical protein